MGSHAHHHDGHHHHDHGAGDERHGWSWRNRTRRAVRATLCTDGDHQGTERAL